MTISTSSAQIIESKLLEEWTKTKTDYHRNSTIHELFRIQVLKTPESVAIEYKNQKITYQELEDQSNQLAYYLRHIGVTKETLVALYLERSPDVIIAILAILKAGGAYLPLDVSAPLERLETIIKDAEAFILITQTSQLNRLEKITDNLQTICIDDQSNLTDFSDDISLCSEVNARNLAYVMYTSGSTGKPKGVCVEHRGVVRLVKNTNYANFSCNEVILQLASIAFDAATFEIWAALLNGGKLVLMPIKTPSLQEIGMAIKQYHVTTLWLTSGLFNLMVEEQIEHLKSLRQLLAGGDVLSMYHVKKIIEELPNCQLINGYGPTENTTFTCCHKITVDDLTKDSIPIGRPIANTQVYILDDVLQLVPIGIAGELYIGGDGLARGYLNQPDLTAEKFIQNPFSDDPDSRLYKTGDRARWLNDGTIEFLGRIDFQVKIRGFRVELGEIEAILAQHPSVRSAVVLAQEYHPGDKRLVAYFTKKDNTDTVAPGELRHFLQQKLPNYMIPSAFIRLEQLPLNANGKVDRKALPTVEKICIDTDSNFVSPRTPTEERLASIWADVLGVKVGIYQPFLEVGGHSLHSTQIVSRVRDCFGVDLPVSAVLEASTIAELSRWIESPRQQQQPKQSVSLLQPISHKNNLPLSVYQERLWVSEQKSGFKPIYNLPMAFQLKGILHIASLEQAINTIIQRHESLRTTFPIVEGLPVQNIAEELIITIPIQQVENDGKTEIQQLVDAEATQQFDLTQEPPIRARLLRLTEKNHILVITIHHIVADGWSLAIFNQELSALYAAYTQQSPCPLAPPSFQYSDFSLWHRQWFQQPEIYTPLVNYWSHKLADAPPLLQLPSDRPRPPLQSFQGRIQSFHLNLELTQQLKNLSQQSGSTLFMTLLASFVILLHSYSSQKDMVIGSAVANRNHTEMEPVIGCFSNIMPLRISLGGNPSFLNLLQHVRQTTLEAYTYQDFPVEQLLPAIKSTRDLSYSPWYQVIFNLLNVPMSNLELTGLNIESLPIEKNTALFDLSLLMWETTAGLSGIFEYNTDLFDERTIEQLIQNFLTLLRELLANPNQSILSLPMLMKDEQYWQQHKNQLIHHILPKINSQVQISKATDFLPQDELEQQLITIWEKVLGVSSIGVNDNFFNLGGHSLLALRLFAQIEKTLGKKLPLATLFQVPTIKELAQVIRHTENLESSFPLNFYQFDPEDYRKLMAINAGRQGEKPRPESLIVSLNHQGNKRPFFFCANGLDEVLPLSQYLGQEQPIYFMESGLCVFQHKATKENIQALAAYHLNDILTLQPEGDYILGGFSFGCLVVYEIAKQLEHLGKKVAILTIVDFPGYDPIFQYYLANIFPIFPKIRRFLQQPYKILSTTNKNNPSPKNKNLQPRIIPGYSGKIHLFLASDRCLSYKSLRFLFPLFGWNKQVVERVYRMPGDHVSLIKEPNVKELADRLTLLFKDINP
ncbi:non-ribosomal peptide synthetase [Nostoc parmelioides]|uniref:Amino acid adenylation domain-containing protein n=1 Tax=Nostoc parmelioides FACHB-3921 TaxID=2692909 RepID=A0ABR8B8L4_9NOSO|nr:non-ribosomal peptide synthetase [Nostoc parmelioides]MBD2250457.1 amino acid adenylation domain-containing protein [Nostoc parmelioides FACHB-3921]